MLYDYDIRLFVEEAKNAFGGSPLCNAFPAYGPAPYNFSSQCEEYLRAIVPKHVLIDYIVNHLGPSGMGYIMTAFEGHYPDRMYEILFKGFSECSFKNCATTHWPQMGYYEDSSEIFDYLREQKWTGLLQQTRSCYPDSFNYYFAKTYPGFVAEIFESWHYPLIGFMDDIEDYFDTTMRNKLDGDTLIEMQYYAVNEFHLYGSSRLGIYEASDTTLKVQRLYNFSRSENELGERLSVSTTKYNKFATDSMATLNHGNKRYEGTNHLGNVLVVYSDKRLIGACNADTVLYYKADLLAAYEYSPFGVSIKQWYANDDTSGYKFGFNGQEKDNEVSGAGNSMTAEYWQYDSRLGRRFNIDPKPNPSISSYACFANNPIWFCDPYGDTVKGNSAAFNNVKGYVNNEIKNLTEDINNINIKIQERTKNGKRTRGLSKQLKKLENLKSAYEEINNEYTALENSTQVYNIIVGGSVPAGAGGEVRFNSDTKYVDVVVSSNMDLLEFLPHELKHAYQFEVGKLSLNYNGKGGGSLYDLQDEVEAYQRTKMFGYNLYSNIDVNWVRQKGYFAIRDRKTQLSTSSLVSPNLPYTLGEQINSILINSAKRGKNPLEVTKDWQIIYGSNKK